MSRRNTEVSALREVPAEIIEQTTECTQEFACLNDETIPLCEVTRLVGKRLACVACQEETSCAYRVATGAAPLCTCLVRGELFVRYGI